MLVSALCLLVCAASVQAAYQWQQVATISTTGGNDAEVWTIGSTQFLAFAVADGADIYTWSESKNEFESFQSLDALGCLGITQFQFGGNSYLAQSVYASSSSYIFKYSSAKNQYELFQTLSVDDPRKFKFTLLEDGTPLIGCGDNSGYFSVFSWVNSLNQFVLFEQLPLSNAQEVCFFNVSGTTYLGVANGGSNPSTVYSFNGTAFNLYQSLPGSTQGFDIEGATLNGKTFLALATENKQAVVYEWDTTTKEFTSLQTLQASSNDYTVSFYGISGVSYLAVGVLGSFPLYEGPSQIWQYNGIAFNQYQTIETYYIEKLAYFEIDGTSYLAAADAFALSSQIFQWIDA